jgi:hypothetical protein
MKNCIYLIIFFSFSVKAQYSLKVKREDNRFLFFQFGQKADTISKNKSDLFIIKLPDSLKNNIQIIVKNGRFFKTKNDSTFQLMLISGMMYSHNKPDTIFNTLVEGNCTPSNIIDVNFVNSLTKKSILKNKFVVK